VSLRLEMLQVARLAPKMLGDSAGLVAAFLRDQMNPDGGFKDRAGNSDLYYTVFGVEGLFALREELPAEALQAYLQSLADGGELDFVHLACLARGWANLPPASLDPAMRGAILARVETFRSADGGYHAEPSAELGTLYGSFLALGAYQDLGAAILDPARVVASIQSLRAADGGYANQHDVPLGLTPSTAAAVTLLRQLGAPAEASVADWLLSRCHPEGGFYATPLAPIPDLLSTATALHALAGMKADIGDRKEPCLDFVDSLWSPRGGFVGSWEDDALDCEYTYYGLLALGHLSL
jgi:prenyltransferase beta subunit